MNKKARNNIDCQFCDEEISANAKVCPHCAVKQINDKKVEKILNYNAYLMFSYGTPLVILCWFINWFLGLSLFAIGFGIFELFIRKRITENLRKHADLLMLQNNYEKVQRLIVFSGIILLILCLLLFYTNPDKLDLREFLKSEYSGKQSKIINEKSKNFGIFSVYTVELSYLGIFKKEQRKYFGVLNRIYELD